jgi:hypothetical protein
MKKADDRPVEDLSDVQDRNVSTVEENSPDQPDA